MNISRRTMIKAAGATTLVALMAKMAGIASTSEPKITEQDIDTIFRPNGLESAANVKGYILENAQGVHTPLATVGTTTGITDAYLPIRLVYTLVDANLVPEDMTFNEIWNDRELGPYAFYSQYQTISTLYDIGNPDYYIAMTNPSAFNNVDLSINYAAFTRDNDYGEIIDDCTMDYETGLAYIPKHHFQNDDGTPKFTDIRIQLMCRIDLSSNLETIIPVNIQCDDPRIKTKNTTEVLCQGHNLEVIIPLCEKESVPYLKEDVTSLWISGMEVSQDMLENVTIMDDEGNLRIQLMGFTIPGIDINIRPITEKTTPILGAKVAYALSRWNQMRIWPWGYLKDDPELDRLCDNNIVFQFKRREPDGNWGITAVDSGSWDTHGVIKNFIYEYFDDIAPYTYNIYFMNGDPEYPDHNIDLDTSSKTSILADMYSLVYDQLRVNGRVPNFSELEHYQNDDPDSFDVWAHWILLPGCDIINYTTGSNLPISYWDTMKNCQFDNDTMIGTPAEQNVGNNYNSCVFTNAICVHSEYAAGGYGEMNEAGQYIGPVYARVLNIDRNTDPGTIVISFHTDGFGENGKGQAAHAIIRFLLDIPTGNLEIVKKLTGPATDSNLEFSYEITLRDKNNDLVSKTYSGVTFTNGKATVKVSANSSPKKIEKIPAGFTYSVVELEHPDYELVTSSGTSDTIVKDETKTAEFTNKRKVGYATIEKKLSF